MNKQYYLILVLFAFLFASCSDDDNNRGVSEEWKTYQANVIQELINNNKTETDPAKKYQVIKAQGEVDEFLYYRAADYITKNMDGDFERSKTRITNGKPDVTDQVVLRYEGWFFDLDGKKIIFDSTEIDVQTGESKNNNDKRSFFIGGDPSVEGDRGVVDGFATILQEMQVDDEVEVCIPYKSGYGAYGNGKIPGHTTLFFDIKLLEIVGAE